MKVGNKVKRIKYFIKWKLIYSLCLMLPIRKNYIIFESFLGNSFTDNPKYLYLNMKDDPYFKNHVFIIVDNMNNITDDVITCKKFSFKYMWYLSQAKYVVLNARVGKRIILKKGQRVIQTWHGTPLKKLVHDMVEYRIGGLTKEQYLSSFNKEVQSWSIMLAPNEYSIQKFKQAFKYEGEIIVGYPRNLPLFQNDPKEIASIKKKLNIEDTKKVYLYTPTFRDDNTLSESIYKHDLKIDLNFLANQKNKIFLIRAHYLIANSFDFSEYNNIIDVSKYPNINDLYLISDCLINDYSSTMFDFNILKKPVILFPYDIVVYETKLRGFYLEYESLSDNICYTINELNDVIINNSESNLKIDLEDSLDIENVIDHCFKR